MSGRGWLLLLVVIALGVGGGFAWTRFEGRAPVVDAPAQLLLGTQVRELSLALGDEDSGLRDARALLVHAGGEATLATGSWPGGLLAGGSADAAQLALAIDPASLPAEVEQATLRVVVRDWSWRGGFGGNQAEIEVPVRIDRQPPRVSVATGLTYVRRGGTGVVVYGLSEPTVRDGVRVGEAFFPGYALGERRVAVYAVPTDAPPSPELRVEAEDRAGNLGRARWPVIVNERSLPTARVNLPERFLDERVAPLASAAGIDRGDLQEAFRIVNTDLRAANEARIREIVAGSAGEKLWEGAFQQLENSQVTSRFAERRTYYVGGARNSEATHFGYDLASTRAAPITAAAAGRVLFADELGIYGNCVLVDHGLGVASLYGHLSRIDVAAGDAVEMGQELGLSGATGLAGGDHLHFAILVGGTYVDPLEWWDPKWVRDNVDARLPPSASGR